MKWEDLIRKKFPKFKSKRELKEMLKNPVPVFRSEEIKLVNLEAKVEVDESLPIEEAIKTLSRLISEYITEYLQISYTDSFINSLFAGENKRDITARIEIVDPWNRKWFRNDYINATYEELKERENNETECREDL